MAKISNKDAYPNATPKSSDYWLITDVDDDNTTKTLTAGNFPRIVSPPSSATDTGIAGQVAYDTDYKYTCIAENTWRRVSHSSW